jgi:hypothetical protein
MHPFERGGPDYYATESVASVALTPLITPGHNPRFPPHDSNVYCAVQSRMSYQVRRGGIAYFTVESALRPNGGSQPSLCS